MRVLLAIVLAAGAPAVHHTQAGMSAARASLLVLKDLGKGWTAVRAVRQESVPLTCRGHSPSAKGIVVTCAAGTFAALRARGVQVAPVSRGRLTISTSLQHTAAYRVVATANGRKLYFD